MKKFQVILLVVCMSMSLSSCFLDDGNGATANPNASTAMATKVIVKAALIDALWGLAETPDPDANCVANSTFTFTKQNPLMIAQSIDSKGRTKSNDVIAVDNINVIIDDTGTEARAADCPAGKVLYTVSASKEGPVKVDTASDVPGSEKVTLTARPVASAFPTGCAVTAHFEKDGTGPAVEETAEETGEEAAQNGEGEEEQTEEVTEGAETSSDEVAGTEDAEASEEEVAKEETTEEEAPATGATGTNYSFKLVIDSQDCSANRTQNPVPTYGNNPNQNKQPVR